MWAGHTFAFTTSVPASWMRAVKALILSAGRSMRGCACKSHVCGPCFHAFWQRLLCQEGVSQYEASGAMLAYAVEGTTQAEAVQMTMPLSMPGGMKREHECTMCCQGCG